MKNGFIRWQEDNNLIRRKYNNDFILVQLYVDDIIFSDTNENLCKEFSNLMQSEFEMSMMRELKFFLGIQMCQEKDRTNINQTKYIKYLLNKYKMNECKEMCTPMNPRCILDKNDESCL